MQVVEPAQIGLVFYPDTRPGLSRRRCGRGFTYIAQDGTRVDCSKKRAELAALAIPPAYENVWISPRANGHLLATGRDARARKQYMYHPRLAEARALAKFDRLGDLASSLPRIRGWIARHLAQDHGTEHHAIALALALIDRYSLRIGNAAYAEENGSFGATTLRGNHLRPDGDGWMLDFPAKGGVAVRQSLQGAALLRALRRSREAGGRNLITWRDARGEAHGLRACVVNETLSTLCDTEITAKAFRTWNGTLAAFLHALKPGTHATEAVRAAADRLHNTPAVARASYIHPDVLSLLDSDEGRASPGPCPAERGLRRGEAELRSYLATCKDR